MVGPRACVLGGEYMEVDLNDVETIGAARVMIASARGLPVGRVQLTNVSSDTPLTDDQVLDSDVNVAFLTLDPVLERLAETALLRATGAETMQVLIAL